MDKFELLGFMLKDLRDNREPDEEDIGPAILRETTRIYELIIRHGHLSRDMFDLSGIYDPRGKYCVRRRYSPYQTTNYPCNFGGFAGEFEEWLLGKDKRSRLELIDLIAMIKGWSLLQIEVVPQTRGLLVTVRSVEQDPDKVSEQVLVTK